MKIDVYDANGKKKGTVELNKVLFEAKINPDLMHRAIVLRNANARRPIAHTLTRGEVSYSTRKLFRQKGTGNARRGARSTNILRGGGVTHGPRNIRNFKKRMPKKERRAALFSSLSVQAKNKNIFGLEALKGEVPKTKVFASLLEKLPQGKKYLFVLPSREEFFEKSARNIPGVKIIMASYLNPFDVLLADKICFVDTALDRIEEVFLSSN